MTLAKRKFRINPANFNTLGIVTLLAMLGVTADTNDPQYLLHDARKAYRQKALTAHPDCGGDAAECVRLNQLMQAVEKKLARRKVPIALSEKKTPRKTCTADQVLAAIKGSRTVNDVALKLGVHREWAARLRLKFKR